MESRYVKSSSDQRSQVGDCRRVHEAIAEFVEAGVELCGDADQRVIADVSGSAGSSPGYAEWGARAISPVSASICRLGNNVHHAALRLGTEVIKDFIAIDPETQPRNVTAWTPVVTDILLGCIGFEEAAVSHPSLEPLQHILTWRLISSRPTSPLSTH